MEEPLLARPMACISLRALSKWAHAVWSRPSASISGLFVVLIATLAALAPLIAPTIPYDLATVSILDGRLPPGQEMFDGTIALLGTDGAGRDVLSAILWGLRTSLIVAISSATIALTSGKRARFLGAPAALAIPYFREER